MDSEFIEDDFFEAKKIEAEIKRQKKMARQERIAQKNHLISSLQELLKDHSTTQQLNFDDCLVKASKYKLGTKEWALSFLNLSSQSELKLAKEKYLFLAQYWHPDKNKQINPEAMKYLNEAWQILKKTI